ncbi:MAG: hypothetical protein CVV37_03785 [Nitrospira bacterium HGW-Nitrospira-1]|nr:MAG: hypothetical protein CVV37_03785 [Nitrospira bacterium HGW-Nitrospira-1]
MMKEMGRMMAETIMYIEREEIAGPDYQPFSPQSPMLSIRLKQVKKSPRAKRLLKRLLEGDAWIWLRSR